jgi:predicted DNA-binding transcriptional regulator YafY
LVTLRVRYEEDALDWLASWGSQVRVLEPASLQKRLAEEAAKVLQMYA